MKQPKTLFLVAIALLPLVLVSCSSIFGGTAVSGGWAGTAFHDGIIYAGSKDGRVVAINSSTQSPQWDYTINAAIYTTPIVDGDLVYVGTYSGRVLALNTLARSQNLSFPQKRYGEWEWDCPIDNAKSNAIVADLLVNDAIYVSSSNGRVYSLDKAFGDERWGSNISDEKLWTSPEIQSDATLYVSTFDGHIYALSTETGKLLDWSFKSQAGFASSPVIYEDIIYAGSFDNKLCAIRIGGSEPLWEFPGGKWFWAAPVVGNGTLYAGCLDGKLYAIEAETGERVWEFDAKSPIVSSPVLMDNLLIVVSESGTVYVFDVGTEFGDEAVPLKAISIGADVKSSFCVQEDLVYIRGENNSLYVVDIDKGELSWKVSLTIED